MLIFNLLRRHRSDWIISKSKPWNSVISSVSVLFHIFFLIPYFCLHNYSNVSKRWLKKALQTAWILYNWVKSRKKLEKQCMSHRHTQLSVGKGHVFWWFVHLSGSRREDSFVDIEFFFLSFFFFFPAVSWYCNWCMGHRIFLCLLSCSPTSDFLNSITE